jgi:hypothetical protein
MSGNVVTFRKTELVPIEVAAQILAWMVYPAKKREREQLLDAIVLLAPREAARRDPRWRDESIIIRAGALLQDAESAERVVRKAWPTLRKRILAGNMALPLIAETADFQIKFSPDGAELRSLNQIVARTAELIGGERGGDERNIKRRIWGTSRPVLHFCAALATVMLRYWHTRWGESMWGLLEDPDAICELVETAEKFRSIIAGWRKPRSTVNPLQQIRIELVS